MTKKNSILVAEDDPTYRQVLVGILERQGYEVRQLLEGEAVPAVVHDNPPDLLLLSAAMRDLDGYQLCRRLRDGQGDQAVPVLLLIDQKNAGETRDIYQCGAADYLTKPFAEHEVLARVRAQLCLCGMHDKMHELAREIEERKRAELALRENETRLHGTYDEIQAQGEELQIQNQELEWLWREAKQAQTSLAENRERLDLALSCSGMAAFDWDIASGQRFWDNNVHRLLGTDPGTFSITLGELMQVIHPEDRNAVQLAMHRAVQITDIYDAEYRAVWPDGSIHHVAAKGKVLRDATHRPYRVVGVCWDVTERNLARESLQRMNEELERRVATRTRELAATIEKLRVEIAERRSAEEGLQRTNRLYSVLTETNHAIVQIKERGALFQDFCRIAVETGNFRLAWVGLVDEGRGEVTVVAAHGATGYLEEIRISTQEEEPAGVGPTARAIRQGTFYICNDFLGSDVTAAWHARGLAHGIRSSASIALTQEGSVIGALTLYAEQQDFFDQRQVKLLRQMGADISFALDNLAREERRREAERLLVEESAERLSEREQHVRAIDQLAHYDLLTNLPNRSSLMERLFQALVLAKRLSGELAVLFIDLDHFKNINDTLGHHLGDALLVQVAQRLLDTTRSADIVARLGGDEFVVVLPLIRSSLSAEQSAVKILQVLGSSYRVQGSELNITASIGICLYPYDGENVQELMKNADIALYHAKAQGRNNFQFFRQEMNLTAQARLALENDLRGAIEREEFLLHYQPQVHMNSGRVVGVEALVRWQHPLHGLVRPDLFIPAAEDTKLILPIGDLVLKIACRQLAAWQVAGLPPLRMAVNLSARQFVQSDLPSVIREIISETGIDPGLLELEITESAAMENPEAAILNLHRLRDMGFELAIDDFGTGHSSLSYLKHFPVHRLKIDRSFVKDIGANSDDSAIAAATIALVHRLGKETVAEGVENETQLAFLKGQQCDIVQGYLISPPLPAAEMTNYLRDNC